MARAPFKLNATIVQAYLEGDPVRSYTEKLAQNVAARARVNAQGEIIGIRSRNLLDGIRYTIDRDTYGLYAIVGTNANNDGFSYPAYHDQHGRPWLTNALRDGMHDPITTAAHPLTSLGRILGN
jgi:hypothetical protein